MVQIIISMFGILFINRILYLVERTEAVSSSKLKLLSYFLQLPIYIFLIFKELFLISFIYIGIFFVTLIVFDKIITYFNEKCFHELHINIIERIILSLKSGKSAGTSTKNVFLNLTGWQKQVFIMLKDLLDTKVSNKPVPNSETIQQKIFFEELQEILASTSNVIEQLKAYRRALVVQKNLRHRSRQALQQSKAQALAAIFIYLGFLFMSTAHLKLEFLSLIVAGSLFLFITGQVVIFKLGGKIRWKT